MEDALNMGLVKNLAVIVPRNMAVEGVKLNFVEQKNAWMVDFVQSTLWMALEKKYVIVVNTMELICSSEIIAKYLLYVGVSHVRMEVNVIWQTSTTLRRQVLDVWKLPTKFDFKYQLIACKS